LNEVSKQVVATAVVKEKLVKDGDAVVLDAGSSATYVAETIFSTELKNLSILTHNNVIILAVSGLTASTNPASYSGVYCHAVVETRIKELLFSWPAERRIIIADYSKIGKGDSHMFGDLSKMKSKLEPLGRGYVVTTKPPKNAKSEEIKVFRDTITTLKEWKIEVIEVDGK
jgi:DeoR/GlpR family transcriptional regulator of sugar metabolism